MSKCQMSNVKISKCQNVKMSNVKITKQCKNEKMFEPEQNGLVLIGNIFLILGSELLTVTKNQSPVVLST